MESQQPQETQSGHEKVPDKKERFQKILDILKKGPSYGSAEDTYAFILQTFAKIEDSLVPEEKDRMAVDEFESFGKTKYNNRHIYYKEYFSHLMFIGENGAIDIRQKDKTEHLQALIKNQPSYAQENMELIFEKRGADQHGVWE